MWLFGYSATALHMNSTVLFHILLLMKGANLHAFTLIEMAAVVVLLTILTGIVVVRVSDTRNSAIAVKMQVAEREFSKGVELLISSGVNTKSAILLGFSDRIEVPNDANYMGMTSYTYRVSSPLNPNASAVNELLVRLDSLLVSNDVGAGRVKGSFSSQELSHFTVDLVDVVGGSLFLKFKPTQ